MTRSERGPLRAVIFDLDGLMLDTERIASEAWLRAGAELGIPVTNDLVYNMIGRTGVDSDAILRSALGSDPVVEELKRRRLDYTNEHIAKKGIPVKPGLIDLLDYLDEKQIAKAVATSSGYERALMKLQHGGILDRFSVISSGDDVERGKPAPDIYLLTAERLGIEPRRCLVLEDSDAGVRAAHAAGMAVIMVPDLKPPAEEVKSIALRVETSLSDVLNFIPELLR